MPLGDGAFQLVLCLHSYFTQLLGCGFVGLALTSSRRLILQVCADGFSARARAARRHVASFAVVRHHSCQRRNAEFLQPGKRAPVGLERNARVGDNRAHRRQHNAAGVLLIRAEVEATSPCVVRRSASRRV